MSIEKYNKNARIYNIDTDGFEYQSAKDSIGTHKVRGFYINRKNRYGDQPVLITDECFINMPSYMCDTVNDIMGDPETTKEINEGLCMADISLLNTKNGKTTAFRFYSIGSSNGDLPF